MGNRKYIYQIERDDCLQVTLCNLLDLKREEVPAFHKVMQNPELFRELYENFLNSLGLISIVIDASYDNSRGISMNPIQGFSESFEAIAILEKKTHDYSHAVLLQVGMTPGLVSIVDPSEKGSDFTIRDLKQIEFIFRKIGD